jgi:hypothetical protein
MIRSAGPNRQTIVFPVGTSIEAVDSALSQLDRKEIERIFRINNPRPPG